MAYNLEPLVQILDQILHPKPHHSWILDPNKKPDLESILEKARFLKDFFETSSPLIGDKIQSLESRITVAAHEAEDVLEPHLADRIRSTREGEKFTFSPLDSLQKVITELDSVEKEIKEMMNESHISNINSSSATDSSRSTDPNPKNVLLVGFSEDLIQLKDRVTRQQCKLEVIPIVGMGGIGKTTLARNVYDDALVISHFDKRAWIAVSQDYNVRGILLGLLRCVIGKLTEEMLQLKNEQLAVCLHKSLYGRRYLIVLDDMWDFKVWDDTKMFLPNDNNGSRILITTRESNVANYVESSKDSHHKMHFLNMVDSWNLLRQKVFGQENCPLELEKIGQKIANNCGGLPLAIHVIGGVLSQAQRTQDSWNQVAKDVSSAVACNDERFLKILSLSYIHLPLHLRPCFLYMGAFPEDYEIRASKLMRLWAAEGFLKPVDDKSLEEAAEMYLKALVDRNLLLVRQQDTNGNVKSCSIHDLLRDLCVRQARQEKLLFIKNRQVHGGNTSSLRRVSAHSSYRIRDMYSSMEAMRHARSFLFVGSASWAILRDVVLELRLLRVLDILEIEFRHFPEEVLELVNLRYLALASHSYFSSSIALLWNLETLIFRRLSGFDFNEGTYEIFHLRSLRHIKFKGRRPTYYRHRKSLALLENLRTLSTMTIARDLHKILESAPNLNKLGLFGFYTVSSHIDLTCLPKLETLKCSSDLSPEASSFLSFVIFPPSLRKLTLTECVIPSGYMNKIGTLTNLEVLKLRNSTYENPTWEPVEGEFCRLQFLLLEKLNLVNWVADETHFPRLKHLVIRDCDALEEIPFGIGEISTLEIIEVHESSPSVAASARKIHEEQVDLGNYGLQVLLIGSSNQ